MVLEANGWSGLLDGLPAAARARVEHALGPAPLPPFDFLLQAMEGDPRERPSPLALTLLETGVAAAVCNSALLSLTQAIRLARAATRLDPRFDGKLLAALTNSSHNWPHDVSRAAMMRVLQVIDAISDCQRLAIPLMKFLNVPNRHLRSKAVKLLARASQNPDWADSLLCDADPRVRSNLIEGMAGHLGKSAEPLLRRAANDSHHRVAVTALLALSRLGDAASREKLERMKTEGDDFYRHAAIWALHRLEEKSTPSIEAPHPSA